MDNTEDNLRAFWQNEVFLWKVTRDITWARWCQAREIDPKQMPRPLDINESAKDSEDKKRNLMRSGQFSQ